MELNLLWLFQKDTSYVFQYKSIYRLDFLRLCSKYAPNAYVYSMDIPFDPTDRTNLYIDIQFKHRLEKTNTSKSVRFVRAL